MPTFPRTDLLLDSESQGSRLFLPELAERESWNAQNSTLWELHRFGAHLLAGVPSKGSEALKPELRWVYALQLFETHSTVAKTFNPPVDSSHSKRKDKFLQEDSFLNEDLNQVIKRY